MPATSSDARALMVERYFQPMILMVKIVAQTYLLVITSLHDVDRLATAAAAAAALVLVVLVCCCCLVVAVVVA